MIRCLILMLLASVLFFPAAALSLDEVRSRLLQGYGLPLRWYNVERPPLLVEGHDPVDDGSSPRHLLKLGPGESATVWLPAWEILRLDAASGPLADDDLEISFSSGGGLYRLTAGVPSSDGRTLLFSPSSPSPLLARIVRPHRHKTPLAAAAYISYRETLDELAPYRQLVTLPLERVMLGRPGRPGEETFWSMAANQTIAVAVKGPIRISLENHLVYPEQESRRSFIYRVEANLDGTPLQLLEFETGPDMEPLRHGGKQRRLLGRRQAGYLDVPAGQHYLNLKAAVPLYVRLLLQERPDYLFPDLNAPNPSAAMLEDGGSPPLLAGSFAGLGDRELAETVAGHNPSPVTVQRAALMSARDNRRREGGVVGAALLREEGQRRPDYPDVRNQAEEFSGFHTFYRDLFPEGGGPSAAAAFRWFLPSRLTEPDAHPFGRAVGEQQTTELVRMLAGSTFHNVPSGNGTADLYRLPARFAPSLLRVAVPTESLLEGAELTVQYDDSPPQRLVMTRPPQLPDGTVPVLPAEAGLLMLADSHNSPWPLTLGGAFSVIGAPAPLLDAAVVELPLPHHVTAVRLRKVGGDTKPLPVALQYRTSGPYRMAETEFQEAESALGKGGSTFSAFRDLVARNAQTVNHATPFSPLAERREIAGKELDSEQLPLVRLIRSLERSYTATVAPPPAANAQPLSSSAESLESSLNAARKAERRGEWLNAVEAWSIPAQSGSGAIRRQGLFGQIEALIRLNEDYLAEHRLKGLFLYGEDAETRSGALAVLERLYAGTNDSDALLSLRAVAFMRTPSPEFLRAFGLTLLEAGERELALQAFLILSPADRPRTAMLQTALRLGWWNSFERILADGASVEERSLWQGLRAMSDGRFPAAVEKMRAGGAEGNVWANHLEEGLRIRSALADKNWETRFRAIVDWEKWQSAHPGQRVPEPEMGSVTASAGAVSLTNEARDTWFHSLRATAGQPVSLRLAGPVKIRIEARPIHPIDSRTPLDGWLQVRNGERLYVQPITRNMPAQGLAIVGDKLHSAGLKVERDIDLGPGLHELQVSGGSLDLLVRVNAYRPALAAAPLPTITPETLSAAVDGLYQAAQPLANTALVPYSERILRVSRDGREEPRQLPFTRRELLSDIQRQTLWLASSHKADLDGIVSLRPAIAANSDDQSALLLGRGDMTGLFNLAAQSSDPDSVRRAVLMLWAAEQKAEYHLPALSMVRALTATQTGAPGLSSIVERLYRRGSWVPVTTVASGAGLRTREVTGWQPETPLLRIRRALLPPAADNEQLLSDTGRMVFSMVNKSATILEITLAAEELPYLIPQPLVVSYQLDNGEPQRLTLRAGQPPRQVTLRVPAGKHAVRIGIEERFADQFLRVGLQERQTKPERKGHLRQPVVNKIERPYQVATQREPIRLKMEGPAVLRIDELRDGDSTITYRMIGSGFQQVEIAPEKGRAEGLYRFFTHVIVAEKPFVPVRYVEIAQTPVPPPTVTIASLAPPEKVRLKDDFQLGRQEDGTWSVTGTLIRRKPVQEGGDENLPPEQFMESSATHRYFNGERRYYESGALFRIREHGGPTLGIQARLSQLPLYVPFTWNIAGSLYLQNPVDDTLLPLPGTTQWATNIQGSIYQLRELTPKTWHRPSIALFGRILSRSKINSKDRQEFDQDIFSRYKAEHRYGALISESLSHRPWLDTLWHGTLSLASNELKDHLVPDHLSLALEWKQLLGAFQTNAHYRSSLYFSDTDRSRTLSQNSLGTELIYNRWHGDLDRLELSARMNWHFESQDITSILSLTWHFNNGRGLRDFFPGDLDFRDLRQRMTPTSRNNGMTYEPE